MSKTKEQISRNMRSNKSKDTMPEILLRKELWSRGLHYRKNCKKIFGKPDIAFVGIKIAVFVDGKMWHGYDWERQKNDFKSNREFWIAKIEGNIRRDAEVSETLEKQHWTIIRFWDFEIKKDVKTCADKVESVFRHKRELKK